MLVHVWIHSVGDFFPPFSFFIFYFKEHSLEKMLTEISLSKAPAIILALVEHTVSMKEDPLGHKIF